MKKLSNIMFVLATFLSFLFLKEGAIALADAKMLVTPVNVQTARSSYGVYPNTLDMVANDIINSINKYSNYEVPDLNSSRGLIESYGLSKHYKEFLMNYRDNRVVDYKTCNMVGNKLGVSKILLVSGGYDVENMFLNKPADNKFSQFIESITPFARIFSKDLFFIGIPFMGEEMYNKAADESPINPYYKLNIQLAMIDTDTGLVVWEKSYNQNFPASDFGNPINSFGENIVSSGKLKKFSGKIANETAYQVSVNIKNGGYKSVKSSIVSKTKVLPRDGKMTKDGQPLSSNNKNDDVENKRKQSYEEWIKERAQY